MSVVVGVDSSTQSCKVLAVDAHSGDVISSGAAAHPDLTSVDPRVWTSALRKAWHGAGVERLAGSVTAAGIAAQQHGMVALDSSNSPVHDALRSPSRYGSSVSPPASLSADSARESSLARSTSSMDAVAAITRAELSMASSGKWAPAASANPAIAPVWSGIADAVLVKTVP